MVSLESWEGWSGHCVRGQGLLRSQGKGWSEKAQRTAMPEQRPFSWRFSSGASEAEHFPFRAWAAGVGGTAGKAGPAG